MVSNSLDIELQELLGLLEGARTEFAGDREYQELRRELPQDWPL